MLCAISSRLLPILSSELPSGWDTLPHYYLFTRMLSLLGTGHISGYDLNWYCGYPEFTLYPPLTYIVASIPHIYSFGFISPTLSFNIFLFSLPLIFLHSFIYASHRLFGKDTRPFALISGILFLMYPQAFAHRGFGIFAILHVGLIANYLGLSFLLYFLGALSKRAESIDQPTAKDGPNFTLMLVFFCAVILTHQLSAIFTAFMFLMFIVFFGQGKRLKLCLVGIVSVLLTSFWLLPFFKNLPLSSGEKIYANAISMDPFFDLFPELTLSRFQEIISNITLLQDGIYPPHFYSKISTVAAYILEFAHGLPWAGILFLIFGSLGLYSLVKRGNSFIPLCFVITLFIFPRNVMPVFSEVALHYYRFSVDVALLLSLITAFGFYTFWAQIKQIKCLCISYFLKCSYLALLLTSITVSSIVRFNPAIGGRYDGPYTFQFKIKNTLQYSNALKVINYLKDQNNNERVAAENWEPNFTYLGTPHFFSTLVPLLAEKSFASGLVVESSLLGPFINATLKKSSEHTIWGRKRLAQDGKFMQNPLGFMLNRLRGFRVRYLITSSKTYYKNLLRESTRTNARLKRKAKFGRYAIFELKGTPSVAEYAQRKPWLFVGSVRDFRTYSEYWYKTKSLSEVPLIFTNKDYSTLSEFEKDSIGGFIINRDPNIPFRRDELDKWSENKKPLIFMNTFLSPEPDKPIWSFSNLNFPKVEKQFIRIVKTAIPTVEKKQTPPEVIKFNGKKIIIKGSGPVRINAGYAVNWHGNAEVFMEAPGFIFVFAKEDNPIHLEYYGVK